MTQKELFASESVQSTIQMRRDILLFSLTPLPSQCQTPLGTHLWVNDADGGLVPHVLLKALGRGRVEAQHRVVAVCVSQKQHSVEKAWKVIIYQ